MPASAWSSSVSERFLRCENGIVPCDNCGETDEHTCHLDGEEYGPFPCDYLDCDHE